MVTVMAGFYKVSATNGERTEDSLAEIFVNANIAAFNNSGKCYILA